MTVEATLFKNVCATCTAFSSVSAVRMAVDSLSANEGISARRSSCAEDVKLKDACSGFSEDSKSLREADASDALFSCVSSIVEMTSTLTEGCLFCRVSTSLLNLSAAAAFRGDVDGRYRLKAPSNSSKLKCRFIPIVGDVIFVKTVSVSRNVS